MQFSKVDARFRVESSSRLLKGRFSLRRLQPRETSEQPRDGIAGGIVIPSKGHSFTQKQTVRENCTTSRPIGRLDVCSHSHTRLRRLQNRVNRSHRKLPCVEDKTYGDNLPNSNES